MTGFTDLDSLTGGLHESELVIIAGRPSMGKTALATNIADARGHQSESHDAVRQPGNVAAGTGRAHALLAWPDQRPQAAQRLPLGRRSQQAARGFVRR